LNSPDIHGEPFVPEKHAQSILISDLKHLGREMSAAEAQTDDQSTNGNGLDAVALSPPADCIKITDDGGVLKHVIAEGSGDLPVRHGRCLGEWIAPI
jgi:hypothetical protein